MKVQHQHVSSKGAAPLVPFGSPSSYFLFLCPALLCSKHTFVSSMLIFWWWWLGALFLLLDFGLWWSVEIGFWRIVVLFLFVNTWLWCLVVIEVLTVVLVMMILVISCSFKKTVSFHLVPPGLTCVHLLFRLSAKHYQLTILVIVAYLLLSVVLNE
jgi:hypothetical protein